MRFSKKFFLNFNIVEGFCCRIPRWAEDAIKPNAAMENITKYCYAMYTDTKLLARLKGGFLLKDILDRFNQKINSKLEPDRSLWLYSAHDFTISNILNGLGLFEVFRNL